MKWMFCLLALVSLSAHGQNRAFKPYFNKGLDLYEKGDYQGALDQFQKAWSVEQKHHKYKVSGAIFADYLPRYYHALCYEKLGQMDDAAQWAADSEKAREVDVPKKEKNKVEYNTNIARIKNAAKQFRAAQAAIYDRGLQQARALIAANKFGDAKAALQKLATSDEKRPEAGAELAALPGAVKNYLRGKGFDAKDAIRNEDFGQAEGIIKSMAGVDNSYDGLPVLRSSLKEARKKAADREIEKARVAANLADKPVTHSEPVKTSEPIVKTPTPNKETPIKTANANGATKPPRTDPRPAGPSARQRAALKKALIASLGPYRLGEPDQALQKLSNIDPELAQRSGNFHWLKGVYLLDSNAQLAEPEESRYQEARASMVLAAKIFPDFEPAADLYPDFVLDFYRKAKSGAE